MNEADYLYLYRTLLIDIPNHFYSSFDGKTQDLTVLSKFKTVPWGSNFKKDKLWWVGFLHNSKKKEQSDTDDEIVVTQVTQVFT